MPIEGATLFKNREEIANDLLAEFQSLVPDVHTGEDSVVRILCEVMATVIESVFLSAQIISEDMFVQTANIAALFRHGDEFGVVRKVGTKSVGALVFTGTGGTVIPIGAEAGYDPLTGADLLYFNTTETQTIPNPGVPTAPVLTDFAAGNVTGSMEYVITFVNTMGETDAGAESTAIVVASRTVRLTAIPLGGAGTTARRIYRQKDGDGIYKLVTTIANNTATTYDDNTLDAGLGGNPPLISTAQRVSVLAQSEDAGLDYNVLPSTITIPTTVPDGVTDVINPAAFTDGTDPELPEEYRARLLDAIRNPHTGSAGDLKTWAEEILGVDTATVFTNDNLGVATPGHATVRISGPNGAVPSAAVIQAVYDAIAFQDIANITIHVGTFTPTVTAVTVTITLESGYILADVTPSVTAAITAYINNLEVAETFRVTGVIAAIVGLAGVADVVVNTPSANQATGATSKRTPGVITVA